MFVFISFKSIGALKNIDDMYLTWISSFSFLFNAGSRLAFEIMQKKIKFKYLFILIVLIEICSAFSFDSLSSSKIGFLICLCLTNIIHGAIIITTTTLCCQIFGKNREILTSSILLTSIAFAGILLSLFVYNFLDSIGFKGILKITGLLAFLALIIVLFFKQEKD